MELDNLTEIEANKHIKKTLKKGMKSLENDFDLYLMLVPMILFFILFSYKPLTGLVIAFKDYSPFRGIWGSKWVGIQYFKEFFTGPYALRTIKNTLVISLTSLIIGFPMPIIFALLLNELRAIRFKKTVQSISYLPHFLSTVIVCGIVVNFLSPTTGVVNTLLKMMGFKPIYFLSIPKFFVPIYTIMGIWKNTGYDSIIYIAALTSISDELYEAATVDGAGRWQQFIYITLPSLMPTIVIMLLIRLGNILNVGYEAIILLYNPSIYTTADVINTFVYRVGITEGRYDYATAIGLFNSVVAFIIVIIFNKISNKLTDTGLW
ncbi:MAG: ABC transporter permease subunit [Clostridiales bacterium]|nr:ABC transporter permease subunit [Clostridiales bacterium]